MAALLTRNPMESLLKEYEKKRTERYIPAQQRSHTRRERPSEVEVEDAMFSF